MDLVTALGGIGAAFGLSGSAGLNAYLGALGPEVLSDEATTFFRESADARRVQLVLALAHRPPLLLLDEPTDGLDRVARDELIGILSAWDVVSAVADGRLSSAGDGGRSGAKKGKAAA